MRTASCEVVKSTLTELVIRDLGPWDRHPAVTNDAESVVAKLLATGVLKLGVRLYCYDSDGQLDELRHDGRTFMGFASGPKV